MNKRSFWTGGDDKLPANSIQVRNESESDCYARACRPLDLKELRRQTLDVSS